jgi:vesicle-fusing ATPase
VNALPNILLIGMTNRKDLLDDALLRPGRLEVMIEIGLPDEKGRLQILKIKSASAAANSFLAPDVDLPSIAARTKNFSGAELEGLMKSAVSFALSRQVDASDLSKPIDEDNIKITQADFDRALQEVVPAFGASSDALERCRLNGIISTGPRFEHLLKTARLLVEQVRVSDKTPLLTLLLEGVSGAGKTALAATLALESGFPFVKMLSAESMVGWSETSKTQQLAKIFEDAYKSPLSIILLDDIERLLEYVAIGPRFSNVILQTLLVLLKKPPPAGRRLLVLGTTSEPQAMADLGAAAAFNVALNVPRLREPEARTVLVGLDAFAPEEVDMAIAALMEPEVPIKRLLMLLEMARQARDEGGGRVSVPSGEGMAVDGASSATPAPPPAAALGHGSGGRIPIHHWNAVLRDLATG